MTQDFYDKIESFKQKTDQEILAYLFDFWELEGQPNPDGSFKVVATYKKVGKDKNGFDYGYFINVRSLNGDILYYPFRLGKISIYTPHNDSYEKEELWQINVKLNKERFRKDNPFSLQLADRILGKPKNSFVDRLGNEKLIRKIFEETGATRRDAKNTANALLSIMGDLYSEGDERFIFELLQNADDQPQDNQHLVSVKLKALAEHLLFTHTGKPFSKEDVESISSIGDSTKKNDSQKTGYKGIGFKSVFSGADTVFIDSGSFSFAFDKDSPLYKSEDNMDEVPWQLKPIWEERYRLPKEVALDSDYFSYPVGIAIQAGPDRIQTYKTKIKELFAEPRFMLFLRHIGTIDYSDIASSYEIEIKKAIIGEGVVTINSNDNTTMWIVSDYDISIPPEIHQLIQNEKLVPNKLKNAQKTRISFATQIQNGAITSISDSPLFCYLPTKVKEYAFPFLVNADFLTTASRESIHYKTWNQFLFQQIGKLTIQWAIDMSDHVGYLSVLPTTFLPESNPLSAHFNVAYKSATENDAFILNHQGNISKQDEIILDTQGLSQLIGPDLFCKIMKTEKCLPSSNVDSKILEKEIFEKIEKPGLEDILEAVTDNPDFNAWFICAKDEQKETLFRWINWIKEKGQEPKEGCLDRLVLNLPLFKFGEKHKSFKEATASSFYITTKHIAPIKNLLKRLNFICSDNTFDENHPLYGYLKTQDQVALFEAIKKSDFSDLDFEERKKLFVALKDFEGVGELKLKKIALFRNLNGKYMPLEEMITYRDGAPQWLWPYIICQEEFFEELTNYLVNKDVEFEDVIWKNRDGLEISVVDLYSFFPWTDERYTRILMNQYKGKDKYRELLPIIEKSGEETKRCYLLLMDRINLAEGSLYKKDSYEYRVLQLAIGVYETPSDFSSKVYYEGHCIKEYSITDEVICKYYQGDKERSARMSLSKLLPQYQNTSGIIEKILNLFEKKKDLIKFFDAKPKPLLEIYKELNSLLSIPDREYSFWNVNGNAFQYLFSVYYRRCKNWYNTFVPDINLNGENEDFINDLMEFLYQEKVPIDQSPFTYYLKKYIKGKFFDCYYIFDTEQLLPAIEKWANDNKKKQYLIDNGVIEATSLSVQLRQLFLEDKPIDFTENLSDEEFASFITFIATANGIERPFTGESQKIVLLQLKEKGCCDLTDAWNLKKMGEDSVEWSSKEYADWAEESKPGIFIYPGVFPCLLSFKNELLMEYEDPNYDYYYDKKGNRIFISNAKRIEDVLFVVAKDDESSFSFDDYRSLCLEGRVSLSKEDLDNKDKTIESLSESNRKKDEIIEQYRARYGELMDSETAPDFTENRMKQQAADDSISEIHDFAQDEIDRQSGRVIERDRLSEAEQISAHKEAEQIIKEKLENDGYDCSKWVLDTEDNDDGFKKWHSVNQVDGIISPDGETINLVIKSAKGGYIYLSATDFEYLTSNRNNVLMVWDGKSVHSVTAEDIFNKDSNVNLIFDTDYTPKHYYAALSKVFQYIKRTTFAVKNPSYNAYDSVTKTFGMDSTTEGIQPLFDDNDL